VFNHPAFPPLRVSVLGLVLISSLLAACAQPAPPLEIRVGVLAILSDNPTDVATSGQPTVNAAKLAVKQVNDAGGLKLGGRDYKVTLLIEDDHNNLETAVAAARKLINQEQVVALIGPQYSRNAIPVADVAENAHVPMISPMSTNLNTTAGKSYVFRVGFIDTFQGQVMAQFAFTDLAARKAAVLYDVANDYNRGIAEIFRQAFEAAGGQVVAFEGYPSGLTDFSPYLDHIQAQGPDVLFLPCYANEAPLQTRQARQAGIKATFISSDSWDGINLTNVPEANGAFFSNQWHLDSSQPASRDFVAAYHQAYNQDPNSTAALTYDAFGLLFRAIQQQGKPDPDAIRAGLAATHDYSGVSGLISYQGNGDPVKGAVILQVSDGKIVFHKVVSP
jgi:branched-chain amino acid transport system substrate-binding protein